MASHLVDLTTLRTVEWTRDGVRLIDQRQLPDRLTFLLCRNYRQVARAIRDMTVRGAPAIGVTAAMGLALAAKRSRHSDGKMLLLDVEKAAEIIRATRPTARNLFWAVERMLGKAREAADQGRDMRETLAAEAQLMADEDVQANRKMGAYGAELIQDGDTILTHCNTGTMATVSYGTALGVIRSAISQGKKVKLIATETRPRQQGARITVYEALSDKIPVTLIVDSAVAITMSKGMVDKVIVGADRITKTAVANKVGTFMIALAAKHHCIPFYVAAPTTTFDLTTEPTAMSIEERDPREVTEINGRQITPKKGVRVFNPAFDLTPLELVTAVITEKGVLSREQIQNMTKIRPNTGG
jgi:methylthioribose-1-phosphate isomerase